MIIIFLLSITTYGLDYYLWFIHFSQSDRINRDDDDNDVVDVVSGEWKRKRHRIADPIKSLGLTMMMMMMLLMLYQEWKTKRYQGDDDDDAVTVAVTIAVVAWLWLVKDNPT